jgi:hypothetical protein
MPEVGEIVAHEPISDSRMARLKGNSHFFLFGTAICVGAFLLFEVQLILGKYILPWFGGMPSVWTACMLVFQVLLLLGYLYAHVLTTYVPRKMQNALHLALLGFSLALLVWLAFRWKTPITPGVEWKPSPTDTPTWKIIQLLAASIAFPFLLLSTTGPLIQKWFARANPGLSPYRLYALSNLGSLLGLLTYPFLIEPSLTVRAQAWVWCAGYAVYVGACALCSSVGASQEESSNEIAPAHPAQNPSNWTRFLWVGLPACASVMLLATTNLISQQVAVIPFLWVIPLCLYLGSFILCFESTRWYRRSVFQPLFLLLAGLSCWLLLQGSAAPVSMELTVYPALLFVSCMISHGELVHIKPAAQHLTQFYLLIALGGALGGIFTGLLAPHIFTGLWEFHTGIVASAIFLLLALAHNPDSWWHQTPRWLPSALLSATALLAIPVLKILLLQASQQLLYGLVAIAFIATGYALYAAFFPQRVAPSHPLITRSAALTALSFLAFALFADANLKPEDVRLRSRNFYGIVSVVRETSPIGPYFYLRNRMTNHGMQFVDPRFSNLPVGYYGPDSGISKLLGSHPRPMRVGVIGLGVGILSAYGRSGDYFRFYEINPAVVSLASGPGAFFTYMRNSQASTDVVLGDARLCLEREAAAGQLQQFDVLVIDAFSGDAIPTHLLTKEAFTVYLQHLRSSDSVIALHISNISLNLAPVVSGLAHQFNLWGTRIHHPESPSFSAKTDWVLLSRNPSRLQDPLITAVGTPLDYDNHMPLWTDDYSNLFRVIRFTSLAIR